MSEENLDKIEENTEGEEIQTSESDEMESSPRRKFFVILGIVAKNGILMLDAVAENLSKTGNLTEALIISGRRRFRPVLMTSLAAILGMLPLAPALGAGSELLQPLAVAVIGGFVFALLLSLVVTPTVYSILYGLPSKK